MARLILGVTGSVAAIKTPELAAQLRRAGHDVRVVATEPALYFFDPAAVEPADVGPSDRWLLRDEDEWPAPVTDAATKSCTSSCAIGPTC